MQTTQRFGHTSGSIESVAGLSRERIINAFPTVYAEGKHDSRSAAYRFISTGEILDIMRAYDLVPTQVMKASVRKEDRKGFEKHLVRLRKSEHLGASLPDVSEVILINSHDGTSSYQLMQGIWRLVCANGCIIGEASDTVRLRHSGRTLDDVVEGTIRIVEGSLQSMEQIAEMKDIQVNRDIQRVLAQTIMEARFKPKEDEEVSKAVQIYHPEDFLQSRRSADMPDVLGNRSLYTTYQVLQESNLRGGVTRRDANWQRHTTRPVKSIDETVRVNHLVWRMTQEVKGLLS